jgi:hypothetical protein
MSEMRAAHSNDAAFHHTHSLNASANRMGGDGQGRGGS